VIAVSSANTVKLTHGQMDQSQAAITENITEEQRDLSFLQNRKLH